MAKLLLSRSKSESRLGRKAREAAKSTESLQTPQKFNEPLPSPMHVPRQTPNLIVDTNSSGTQSVDIPRPKTSGGRGHGALKVPAEASPIPNPDERPKTSHGPKKDNALEEPNFSILNRSYTWTREQSGASSTLTPSSDTASPIYGYPARSSSRQQNHPNAPCEIGIALGSPTHHPKTLSDARSSRMYAPEALFQRSLPQHYVSLEDGRTESGNINANRAMGLSTSAFAGNDRQDDSSRGGWKKFFGKSLFHKKASSPQKAQLSQTSVSQLSQTSTTSTSSTRENKMSLEKVGKKSVEQEKKASMEGKKVSMDTKPTSSVGQASEASLDSLVGEIEEAEALYQPKKPTPSTAPIQFLDIEIPKVEMERYSVMFDSLLNHQQQKPSIYARRKSGINGVAIGQKISENTTVEPILKLAPKKDSLPLGVNKSPLWLFPATPRTPKSPGRPRAMTTPSESSITNTVSTPELIPSTKKSRPESDIMPSLLMMLEERNERSLSRAEKVPPTPFSVISEGSELDSPYSPQYQSPDNSAPWVRKFSMVEEPEWEMVTTTPLRPRTPSPTEVESNECEAYVAKAATISIARQISVSKRQLLLPVISNPERFVARAKSEKQQSAMKELVPLVIRPPREVVSPAPTSAVSSEGIALAL